MYKHVVVGGTFDHIHRGHEAVLSRAFLEGNHVTVGVTSDSYVAHFKRHAPPVSDEDISGVACPCVSTHHIQSFSDRKKQLEHWLKENGFLERVTIVSIHDIYGPTVGGGEEAQDFDAVVVSQESRPNALRVNTKRKKEGLPPLAVIVVPMVHAEDEHPISSTRVRKGEIDEKGRLILPDILRPQLVHPIGAIIPDTEPLPYPQSPCISIGDTTTDTLIRHGVFPVLACIDFHARRKAFDWEEEQWDKLTKSRLIRYFTSGPGYISGTVIQAIKSWGENGKPSLFVIDGEEDLLVLPAVLYAPIGYHVYYGQPTKGIVDVLVTPQKKQEVDRLLRRFI